MRITSQGQVTIPQQIRKQCGLLPNTELRFVVKQGWVRIEKSPEEPYRGSDALLRLRGPGLRTRLSTADALLTLTRGEELP